MQNATKPRIVIRKAECKHPVMASIGFYHCFPRVLPDRTPEQIKELGLATLSMVLEHGLLLTPEEQVVGDVTLRQSRICFTALQPLELWRHSRQFGHFAIEYSMEDFLSLGAFPPRAGLLQSPNPRDCPGFPDQHL